MTRTLSDFIFQIISKHIWMNQGNLPLFSFRGIFIKSDGAW